MKTESKKKKIVLSGGPHDEEIWTPYIARMMFIGKLCASVPGSEELIRPWLDARKPSVQAPNTRSIPETVQEVIQRLPDKEAEDEETIKRTTLVFEQVDGKLCVRLATLKAHIKDCTSQVQNQLVGRIKGERNLTTRVKNGLYITGGFRDKFGTEMIHIMRDGKPLTEPDGYEDKAIHAIGPRGQQLNALKRIAYVLTPTLTFRISILGKSVKLSDVGMVLKYGAVHGYAGERGMQEGQYKFEIEEV